MAFGPLNDNINDNGITLYGCSTQKNIDLVQRVQNHAARLIMGNFDYINCRGIDLVKRLDLYTIRERRDYFLTTLMFKAIHGIAPHYLSDRIDMHFDIHGYNTREAGSMNVYLPAVHKEIYRNSFLYSGGKLWNELPDFVKNSTNIEVFKRNYRIYKSLNIAWISNGTHKNALLVFFFYHSALLLSTMLYLVSISWKCYMYRHIYVIYVF